MYNNFLNPYDPRKYPISPGKNNARAVLSLSVRIKGKDEVLLGSLALNDILGVTHDTQTFDEVLDP